MKTHGLTDEVRLAVRVTEELRRAVKRHATDLGMTTEGWVGQVLEAEVAKGSTSAAVVDRR